MSIRKLLKKSSDTHPLLSPRIPIDNWLRALESDEGSVGLDSHLSDGTAVQLCVLRQEGCLWSRCLGVGLVPL